MTESSHTSTAQGESATPLLLLQPPAWEEVPSNPQLSAINETPLPQWMRPINEGLQRLYEHLVNTPLVMKSDDVRKAYKASIACYTAVTAPLAVSLEINNTQATAFQTRAKETFDSFMSESWRHIAANAKTTKERQQAVNQLNQHHKAETARLRDQLAQAQMRIQDPLREIIKKALPEKIIKLIAMSQEGEPDDDDDDAYFNALRKAGRYYDKYSARKRDESSTPAATHKSKAKASEKPKTKRRWPSIHAALQGIDQSSIDKRKESRMQCWRCGRNNHHTLDCFANTSLDGKALPPVPARARLHRCLHKKENQYPRQPVQQLSLPPWPLPTQL